MISKGNRLYSIFKFKCPHCHEGEFFKSGPYDLSKAGQVLEECPVCHKSYHKEPGFYYGSMYVSYALGVALFTTIYLSVVLFFPETNIGLTVAINIISLLLLAPLIYALSKIIWANFFYSYDKTLDKK